MVNTSTHTHHAIPINGGSASQAARVCHRLSAWCSYLEAYRAAAKKKDTECWTEYSYPVIAQEPFPSS